VWPWTAKPQLTERSIKVLRNKVQYLEVLDLNELGNITKVMLHQLIQHSPKLRDFHVDSSSISNDDQFLIKTIAPCTHLISLDLSGYDLITNIGIKAIAEGCPSLRKLDLSWCAELTDAALNALADKKQQLVSLNLAACKKVTPQGIINLIEHNPNLENLDLSSSDIVNDAVIKAAARCCPKLASLNLLGVPSVTNKALIAIAEASLPLTDFRIGRNQHITDGGIDQLLAASPKLQTFYLSDCENLTDNTVRNIWKKGSQIETLILVGRHKYWRDCFSAEIVTETPCYLKSLKTISVAYNEGMNCEMVKTILANAPNLVLLDVNSCQGVSLDFVKKKQEELRMQGRKVKIHKNPPFTG